MKYKEACYEASKLLGINQEIVEKVYRAHWQNIRTHIEELPLREDGINENDYNTFTASFSVEHIGKLSCTYQRYKNMKLNTLYKIKGYEKYKCKENKTNVHSTCDNNGYI